MEENAPIQPRRQGGSYLRAGWKMILLLILCLLQASGALKPSTLVSGDPGGTVTIKCQYAPTPVNKHQRKYWCRMYPPQRICHAIITTNHFISQRYKGRVTLVDFPSLGIFKVTLAQLVPEDAGYYRCGIGPRTDKLFVSMNLTVSTDSTLLTRPSSTTPMTTLATRDQAMETLGTTSIIGRQNLDTSVVAERWVTSTSRRDTTPGGITQEPVTNGATIPVTGEQHTDTTLLSERWKTRASRRDSILDEVTKAPETIGETITVMGRQDLGTTLRSEGCETRASRRNATPAETTQVSGTPEATTPIPNEQHIDTILLSEGWKTRTSRRDSILDEVTKASETTGVAAIVLGGQDLETTLLSEGYETRASRRNATPAETTQVSGTPEATTPIPDEQHIDTILLSEGWETRTSRRDSILDEVTKASETTGVAAIVLGGQDLETTLLSEGYETRASRRNATPAETTQVLRTPEATAPVSGEQHIDITLFSEGWETTASRRDSILAEVTKASETTGVKTIVRGRQDLETALLSEECDTRASRRNITLAETTQVSRTPEATTTIIGGQAPKSIKTTSTAGGQDFDITLAAKRQESGIHRGDQTPVSVTHPPTQASSNTIQALGTPRLTVPSAGDWVLKTTEVVDPVSERQTSGAKGTANRMEGGLVLGTRAGTKTIVETIRERTSIRSTNGLTEGTMNVRTPVLATRHVTGTTSPSKMVRDNLREVTLGTDQQTQGTIRVTAPDADVDGWFSGAIRKRKTSVLEGTSATDRENHSEEPLRRIPGTAFLIPPSNKPFIKNSISDQRRISMILITLSTVLFPLALLVMLLLHRKLRKRISLQKQRIPTLAPIQLTNVQDLPEELNMEIQPNSSTVIPMEGNQ